MKQSTLIFIGLFVACHGYVGNLGLPQRFMRRTSMTKVQERVIHFVYPKIERRKNAKKRGKHMKAHGHVERCLI